MGEYEKWDDEVNRYEPLISRGWDGTSWMDDTHVTNFDPSMRSCYQEAIDKMGDEAKCFEIRTGAYNIDGHLLPGLLSLHTTPECPKEIYQEIRRRFWEAFGPLY